MPWVGCRYTMGRGVKIPWIGGSKYHEYEGRYTMVRGVKMTWVREIKIP